MNYLLLFILISLYYIVDKAECLQCHQCSTLEYKTCRDPYAVDNLGDCDDDTFCVKYKTVVKMRDSGYINGWERASQVVTRTCEPRQGKKEGCEGWQNNGGITVKCWCGTDGCNAATPGATAGIVAVVMAVIVSLVMAR